MKFVAEFWFIQVKEKEIFFFASFASLRFNLRFPVFHVKMKEIETSAKAIVTTIADLWSFGNPKGLSRNHRGFPLWRQK